MQLTKGEGGQRQLVLGPIEMWLVGGVAAFVGFVLLGAYNRVGDLAEGQIRTTSQLSQLSGQITTLSAQLASVPELKERVVKLETKADQTEEDLRELKAMRGLK